MYLFEWPETREREALYRFFSGPHLAYEDFWWQLGVPNPAWFGVNLPKGVFFGEGFGLHGQYAGDVDILVGSAIPDGADHWRPSVNELAALEVKVSWFGRSGGLHATKEGRLPRARQQAHEHLHLGLRHAALLWIVVTEPVRMPGQHDWLVASSRAGDAFDAVRGLSGYTELCSQNDPIGFAVFPWGAVAPGEERTEEWAGAGAPQIIRAHQGNPYLQDERVMNARESVRATFAEAFGESRFHNLVRAQVFVACCEDCRRLFVTGNVRRRECKRCAEGSNGG